MRIISFSADGLREAAQRGFYDWLSGQDADFVCIQDLRCSEYDLQDDVFFPPDYNAYFFDDVNGRDNGVAIYCRTLPKAIMTGLGFADFDMQGRYIQADYGSLSVGCLLAPVAGDGDPDAQEAKNRFFSLLGAHLQKVRNKRRDFIICGNWRIAHTAADVQDSASNSNRSGFLPDERAWMDELLDNGYVDAFRQVSSDADAFSYWPGERDVDGWRIDLQIVSQDLQYAVEHAAIYTGASFSRHAPVIIDYDLEV
jgi:exodeoxyribonuclease-3